MSEALALGPQLVLTHLPDDEDELTQRDPADAWNWEEAGAAQDGEWPPIATAHALSYVSRDVVKDLMETTGGQIVHTTHSGEYLALPLHKEAELVAALGRHGLSARRDDGLVKRLNVE